MLHYLISRDTLLWVGLQELGDQVLGRAGDGVKELGVTVRASSSSSRHLL